MPEVRVIKTWGDFEDKFYNRLHVPTWMNSIVFRGQEDANWPLEPRLARSIGLFPRDALPRLELRALDYFVERAGLYLDPSRRPNQIERNPLEWWPVMQHYGVPTRLVDWTRSVYVAAFFAVRDFGSGKNGAIYYAHCDAVNHFTQGRDRAAGSQTSFLNLNGEEKPIEPSSILFTTSSAPTNRMVAQQGLFSVCRSPLTKHDEAIAVAVANEDPYFFGKVEICHSFKLELFIRLQQMNITSSSLFPGADGLSRDIADLLRLQIDRDGAIEAFLATDPKYDGQYMRSAYSNYGVPRPFRDDSRT